MLWATSPAATELESLMCDWMLELLDLPDRFRSTGPGGGVIQGTASEATLCAILAARERATEGRANRAGPPAGSSPTPPARPTRRSRRGCASPASAATTSASSTSTTPSPCVRTPSPPPSRADRAAGLVPFFVTATAGTTSSLAFDPVPAIADVCRREGVWLHVDAAMAGIAALCPEHRWVNAGVERADSYCTNPHKWMGINFDCDLFYVADRAALLAALSILPEYLRTAAGDAGAVIDYRDWQIPLGRRFRALKVWFTLRADGPEPARAMIRRHVALGGRAGRRGSTPTPASSWPRRRRSTSCACAIVDGDAATDALVDGGQRHRRRPVHPHRARRAFGAAGLHRRPHHRAAPRRGGVGPPAIAGRYGAIGLTRSALGRGSR